MQSTKQFLSLIIPVHNEAGNIEWHHEKIVSALSKVDCKYEIIYVDDGSTDDSLEKLTKLSKGNNNTRVIVFSRNFGKEAATSAGLSACKGDAALILDADGQHPIGLVDKFLNKWREGYQVVIGVRQSNTKEGLVKRYGSKVFYRLINGVSDGETIPRSTDFRLLDRRVIDEFNLLTEHKRISRGLVDWLGFKRTTLEFDSPARHSGEATYSFPKLVKLALHAFVSQTTKPLQVGGILGSITMLLSFIVGLFFLIEKYVLGDPLNLAITGSAIVALFATFLVSIVLICQWFLALYIESIHTETQNRPLYIVDKEI